MSILTRYLLQHFLSGFFKITGIALVMILLIDGISTLQRFSGRIGFNWEQILLLILNRIPPILTVLIPAIAFLATIFVTNRLNRQNEITILRSSGFAIWQMVTPFLIAGLLVATVQVFFQEQLVPQNLWTVRVLKDALSGKTTKTHPDSKLFWYRSGQQFVHVGQVDSSGPGFSKITLLRFDDDHRPITLVTAARGTWQNDGLQLTDGAVFTLTEQTGLVPFNNHHWPRAIQPEQLGKRAAETKHLSTQALWRTANRLQQAGHETNGYLVALHSRLAAPMITLVAIYLAFPFALRLNRQAGVVRSLFAGLLLGFALFVVTDLSIALGLDRRLSPLLAAWSPVALFIGIGIFQMLKREAPQ